MNNYIEIINEMDYPANYEVSYAYGWIHPENIPKKIITLGKFEDGFYKMPEWHTNYNYLSGKPLNPPITVPIVNFKDDLFKDNLDITDLILSNYQGSLPIDAFKGMKNLERIWLPKQISYIPKDCFKDCTSLKEIYYEGSEDDFKKIKIYYKLYRVIHKLGPNDDVEVYYDEGNLPFIDAMVYYNQVRDKKEVIERFIRIGKTDITKVLK